MAIFETSELVGTRVRFQRFADSKIFNGWVRSFERGAFVLLVDNAADLVSADRFVFNISANQTGVCFLGDFTNIDVIETASGPERVCLFQLVGKVDYRPSSEEARHRVEHCAVRLATGEGKEAVAVLHDVSAHGAGILTGEALEAGQTVTLHLEVGGRAISLTAEVRHVTRPPSAPEMYRAGLKIVDVGRLEGALWRSLSSAA